MFTIGVIGQQQLSYRFGFLRPIYANRRRLKQRGITLHFAADPSGLPEGLDLILLTSERCREMFGGYDSEQIRLTVERCRRKALRVAFFDMTDGAGCVFGNILRMSDLNGKLDGLLQDSRWRAIARNGQDYYRESMHSERAAKAFVDHFEQLLCSGPSSAKIAIG